MAGTITGAKQYKKTMIAKHGSREAWVSWMKTIASKGGHNSNTGGYASDKIGKDGLTGKQRASINGAIGGKKSRRKHESNK